MVSDVVEEAGERVSEPRCDVVGRFAVADPFGDLVVVLLAEPLTDGTRGGAGVLDGRVGGGDLACSAADRFADFDLHRSVVERFRYH